jgi:hypothetical protein
MMPRPIRLLILGILLIGGSVVAVWLSWALPTSLMLALAAGAMTLAAGAALWRLWGKW